MASQSPATIEAALAMMPSLPRPMLSRLVTRIIERLDEIDGDENLEEDNEDCGHDENEPDFRKRRGYRKNEGGPGCTIVILTLAAKSRASQSMASIRPNTGSINRAARYYHTPTSRLTPVLVGHQPVELLRPDGFSLD